MWLGQSTLKHVKDAVQVSTGWSQADSQIQSTLSPQAHTPVCGSAHTPVCPGAHGRAGRGSQRAVCLVKPEASRQKVTISWLEGSCLCRGSLSSKGACCRGELAASGLGCGPLPPARSSRLLDAVPTHACTSPGSHRLGWIVKETHSAMNSPDASPVWPASTWWLFSSRCCSR